MSNNTVLKLNDNVLFRPALAINIKCSDVRTKAQRQAYWIKQSWHFTQIKHSSHYLIWKAITVFLLSILLTSFVL